MSGITIKDLIRIAKKGESDDRELVVAWNRFDPDYEGGSAESDLLADRIRQTMPQPMHIEDPTGEFHWELIDRIRETALDPEEEIDRLNLDWEHDPVDHCKHTGDAITTEDVYKAVACAWGQTGSKLDVTAAQREASRRLLDITKHERELACNTFPEADVSAIDWEDGACMGDEYFGLHFTIAKNNVTLHVVNCLATEDPECGAISGNLERIPGEDGIYTDMSLDMAQAAVTIQAIAKHPQVFDPDHSGEAFQAIAREDGIDGTQIY